MYVWPIDYTEYYYIQTTHYRLNVVECYRPVLLESIFKEFNNIFLYILYGLYLWTHK